MLTRLRVKGFKNLVDVDISFGPFTCIAGVNGVGKSNLFDAIRFLSALADAKPLVEAALSVRGESGRGAALESIFHRQGGHQGTEMSLEAEMLVPKEGVDDLGQKAEAAITFLRYRLDLVLSEGTLSICREELEHITQSRAREHLRFPQRPVWRKSVVTGRRTSPFISTEEKGGEVYIKLHQDKGSEYLGGGRPRPHVAAKLPRTVLSSANAAESATAVMARREMQSWRMLQLEPSALRTPDTYRAPSAMNTNGAHMPATLARLAHQRFGHVHPSGGGDDVEGSERSMALFAEVANRLSELIEGVRSIRVDADERRELLTLMLTDRSGTEHEARALSDGTLRFLALAILESDPEAEGVLCLEEPENGIHPERIPSMLRLLRDLAVDPGEPVDTDNPLRQVIVNTHSPTVVQQILEDDLLLASSERIRFNGHRGTQPAFRWLEGTWRAKAWPEVSPIPLGDVVTYLNPVEPKERFLEEAADLPSKAARPPRRVMDREDLQMSLPFG